MPIFEAIPTFITELRLFVEILNQTVTLLYSMIFLSYDRGKDESTKELDFIFLSKMAEMYLCSGSENWVDTIDNEEYFEVTQVILLHQCF